MGIGRGEVEGVPETIEPPQGKVRASDRRRRAEGLVTLTALIVITALAFGIWLSWYPGQVVHDKRDDGWRITGITVVLVIAAAAAGWRRHVDIATMAIPCVLTVCFAWFASSYDKDDGLSSLGATLMFLGSTMGVRVVASLARRTRNWIQE